jgi:hypothetical protein
MAHSEPKRGRTQVKRLIADRLILQMDGRLVGVSVPGTGTALRTISPAERSAPEFGRASPQPDRALAAAATMPGAASPVRCEPYKRLSGLAERPRLVTSTLATRLSALAQTPDLRPDENLLGVPQAQPRMGQTISENLHAPPRPPPHPMRNAAQIGGSLRLAYMCW